MTCILCNEPHAAGDLLFEDARVLVILHNDCAVRGHTMVVWKEHVENVADLPLDEYLHFAAIHHRVERALLAATNAERAILFKLGIASPHLHLHLYPVSASLDREAVMEIIEARVRDSMDHREREAFINEMRERLATMP